MTVTPNRGTFAWLAIGVMAFTIYGSFVPFRFHARGFDNAIQAAEWVVEHRSGIQSRSDFVANVILGIPLGFCLLAALRLDKPGGPARDLLAALVLWPWCIVFSAAVEFGQLFFYERTCSGSDVIAQSMGSLVGMLAWLCLGDRLVRRFRRIWQGERIGGTAGRLLVVYVAVLAIVLWLPLDLTLSPAELYHKNFDGVTKLVIVPFSEITKPGGPGLSSKLPTWLELAGLCFPAGLLAGCKRRPHTIGYIALIALALACILEAGQLFVKSRSTSATDLIVISLGFLAGWGLMRLLKTTSSRGLSLEMGLLLGQAWLGVLLVRNWFPFDFQSSLVTAKWAAINWIPFAAAYEKNYLSSLEEAAAKTLLYAPLGAVVAAVGVRRVVRRRTAVFYGVLAAALVESGQLALPTRIPSPTDLIFGGLGAWLGAATALRIRAFGNLPPTPAEPLPNPVRFRVT